MLTKGRRRWASIKLEFWLFYNKKHVCGETTIYSTAMGDVLFER